MNIYAKLTEKFNQGKLRAILSSGQAVVLHRLAIMSKDGDWIIREDAETLDCILSILEEHNAKYRYGAPLDKRWLEHGWSSHFEFMSNTFRVRTDFVSRPPRISEDRLARLWKEQEECDVPYVKLHDLAELKKTNREKDYVIIGELARKMPSLEDQVRFTRSARDILVLYRKYPEKVSEIITERNIPVRSLDSLDDLEAALDAERRRLIHLNEQRLSRYYEAAQAWAAQWRTVEREIAGFPLKQAHEAICQKALNVLPFKPEDRPAHGNEG